MPQSFTRLAAGSPRDQDEGLEPDLSRALDWLHLLPRKSTQGPPRAELPPMSQLRRLEGDQRQPVGPVTVRSLEDAVSVDRSTRATEGREIPRERRRRH